jgi:hypothetical protein
MPWIHMREWRYSSTIFNSSLVGSELSASRGGRFTLGETAIGIHWIGGGIGLRGRLDTMENRKILPLPGIEPRPSKP